MLAVLLVAFAMACPAAPLGTEAQKPWLVLQDVSQSVRGQEREPIEPPGMPTQLRTFGLSPTPPAQTEVTGSLRMVAARADELAGVVIRTDGQFHDDWQPAAQVLGRSGLDVLIDPLDSPPPDARVVELTARRENSGVLLRVTVVANADMRRELTVTRTSPGERTLLQRELRLRAGEPATFRLTDALPADSHAAYQAQLTPADAFGENDSHTTPVLPISGQIAVVAPEGLVDAQLLRELLERSVKPLTPADAPVSADGWGWADAVVLVSPDGSLPRPDQRAALTEAVLAGTGLVIIGADDKAARDGDPINRIAPLTSDFRRHRPLKVAVALDVSGSMAAPVGDAGRTMFDRAVEAVLSLRPHLTERDSLAVLTFAGEPNVAYDSGEAPADFAALSDALEPIRPGGATYVLPAVREAMRVLRDDRRDRLLIVVSDLQTEPFDAAGVAGALRDSGISPAIVLTGTGRGDGEPPPLERLAQQANAPLVVSRRLDDLAEIFERFLRRSRGPSVRRGEFHLEPVADALGMSDFPLQRVTAYALCAAQPRANVLAKIDGDPVLAYARAGLGQCVQLAVPLSKDDNTHLVGSAELSELLAAAAAHTARPAGDTRFAANVHRRNGRLKLQLLARDDAGPINNLSPTVHVTALGEVEAQATSAGMQQTAPGVYEGELEAPSAALAVRVTDETGSTLWQDAVAPATPPEFAAVGADWRALDELANLTRGQLVIAGGVERHMREATVRTWTELWPVLLAGALAVMLIEWAGATIARRFRRREAH